MATAIRTFIEESPLLKEGQRAPDFSVPDHTGRIVRLSDYSGKNLLLWFYPKANTPG